MAPSFTFTAPIFVIVLCFLLFSYGLLQFANNSREIPYPFRTAPQLAQPSNLDPIETSLTGYKQFDPLFH